MSCAGQPPGRRGASTMLVSLAGSLALAGCTPSLSSGDQGFVSGDGTVQIIDEADRRAPKTDLGGESVGGEKIMLSDFRGKVVVMPVWGSWCAPCREEAPLLSAASADLADDGVVFLGINSRDASRANAAAFERNQDVRYPSIYDPGGEAVLAFNGLLPLMTIPAFAVIDAEGRVAARILGEVDTATLYGVVEDVLDNGVDLTATA